MNHLNSAPYHFILMSSALTLTVSTLSAPFTNASEEPNVAYCPPALPLTSTLSYSKTRDFIPDPVECLQVDWPKLNTSTIPGVLVVPLFSKCSFPLTLRGDLARTGAFFSPWSYIKITEIELGSVYCTSAQCPVIDFVYLLFPELGFEPETQSDININSNDNSWAYGKWYGDLETQFEILAENKSYTSTLTVQNVVFEKKNAAENQYAGCYGSIDYVDNYHDSGCNCSQLPMNNTLGNRFSITLGIGFLLSLLFIRRRQSLRNQNLRAS